MGKQTNSKLDIAEYIPKKGNSFIRYPIALLPGKMGENIAKTGMFLLGAIFTTSCVKDNPSASCARSITDFQKQFGRARSTICDNLGELIDSYYILQKKHYHERAEYTMHGIEANAPFLQIEDFFLDTVFPIIFHKGKPNERVEFRKLSDLEVFTLARIATICKDPDNEEGVFESSVQQLAKEFRCNERTMIRILDALTGSRLVKTPDKYKYRRHNKRLRFYIHPKLKRCMASSHKASELPERVKKARAERSMKQELEAQRIREANERAEREHFYSERKERAEAPVMRRQKRLEADEEYQAIKREVKALEIKCAKAEIYSPEELPALQAELEAASERLKDRALELEISPDMLVPKYQCMKCSDTGYQEDGKPCDCYRRDRAPGRRLRWKLMRN